MLRIVAPTQPSVIGEPKLTGSPLQTYRKRVWQPRIRNAAGSAPGQLNYYTLILCQASRITYYIYIYIYTGAVFPTGLRDYGLSEERLQNVFSQVLEGKEPEWRLKGIPEIQFYRQLHPFLKKWPVSYRTSKQAIGKFYCAIDPNLMIRGLRADNVYRFIKGICQGAQSPNKLCHMGIESLLLFRSKGLYRSNENIK